MRPVECAECWLDWHYREGTGRALTVRSDIDDGLERRTTNHKLTFCVKKQFSALKNERRNKMVIDKDSKHVSPCLG